MLNEISPLVEETAGLLMAQGLRMATAESCTGGWIAQQATALPGSSDWFECGFVSYSNQAKQAMLGVREETLARNGAVSEAVVLEMALGAINRSAANIAVAVSGVAGPSGGSKTKPVGTVWIAWAGVSGEPYGQCFHFPGDRQQIRWQTVEASFTGLLKRLTI